MMCFSLPVHFQGGRNVLCLYGYSNQQPDGLSFPDDVIDPDVGRVAAVTLEVMSLRMELEMLIKVWDPHEAVWVMMITIMMIMLSDIVGELLIGFNDVKPLQLNILFSMHKDSVIFFVFQLK